MYTPVTVNFDFCVLITVFNDEEGLIRSLQSVCYDPLKFCVVVVDDGSAHPLIHSILANELPLIPNLHVIRLPRNGGITKALNVGLAYLKQHINFRYIARLDCGDICSEQRFHRQVAFLDEHRQVDLVGSWCIFKDYLTGQAYRYTIRTQHEDIMRQMHFKNVFIHPTVMWRATEREELWAYPENFPHAEDYGFFYELLQHGKAAVLPYYLMVCEISRSGLSISYRRKQMESRIRVVRQYRDSWLYGMLGELRVRLLLLLPAEWALSLKKRLRNI